VTDLEKMNEAIQELSQQIATWQKVRINDGR
jgi:hypothetical protein